MNKQRRHPIGQDLVLSVTLSNIVDETDTDVDAKDIDITFAVSCGGVTKTFINDSDDNSNSTVDWADDNNTALIALCTDDFKPGDLKIRVTASIPDTRFHDDLRKEIADCDPLIKLY